MLIEIFLGLYLLQRYIVDFVLFTPNYGGGFKTRNPLPFINRQKVLVIFGVDYKVVGLDKYLV